MVFAVDAWLANIKKAQGLMRAPCVKPGIIPSRQSGFVGLVEKASTRQATE